jgi:hypothetical protein
LDQALEVALSVPETEKQKKFSERFYASFNVSLCLHSPDPTRHDSKKSHGSAEAW